MLLSVTTVPGLEDVVVEELKDLARSWRVLAGGRLILEVDRIPPPDRARSVENMGLVLYNFKFDKSLKGLREGLSRVLDDRLLKYITPFTTIGVRAERIGDHEFESPHAASICGEAIVDYVGSRAGFKPTVNLARPDVLVELDIVEDEVVVSLRITRRSLRDRPYRVYQHPASLNPIIAFAMNVLAEVRGRRFVCDIMCGSGTIAIEGASLGGVHYVCMDLERAYVLGAARNAKEAGVDDSIDFVVGDARIPPLVKCDSVVFNPPYGIRMRRGDIERLYEEVFARLCEMVQRRVVLITPRRSIVRKLAKGCFKVVAEKRVYQGGLYASIFVLNKS